MRGVTILCFAASYAGALGLELYRLWRPGQGPRTAAALGAAAGLLAHTIYLGYHGLPLQGEPSGLLVLAWILAVFALVGSIHHARQAWGVFVWPVVLGLVAVAWLAPAETPTAPLPPGPAPVWVWLHLAFVMLGAVGLAVAFVASVMYLVQADRLKHKKLVVGGFRLLSLERLEAMHGRALAVAFPLFTCGLGLGMALLTRSAPFGWTDPKVLATGLLWANFAVLVYLRYGLQQHGRRVAWWTVAAFGLLVLAFAVNLFLDSGHRFEAGTAGSGP